MTYVDDFGKAVSYDTEYAEAQVFNTYGDVVSVEEKLKALFKFGRRTDCGTSKVTVAGLGASEAHETFLTSDTRVYLSSSSTSDTAVTVKFEYHTVTGSGTDAEFTFAVSADHTLTGQTEVDTGVDAARVSRIYVSGATAAVGTVYAYTTSGVSAGVPTTASSVKATIPAGDQQSQKAATTISNLDYFFLTEIEGSINDKTSGVATITLQVREVGGVFRDFTTFTVSNGMPSFKEEFHPYHVIKKNSDIRCVAVCDGTGTDVGAEFDGFLAKVIV